MIQSPSQRMDNALIWLNAGIIKIGEIDEDEVEIIQRCFTLAKQKELKKLTLHICSYGGSYDLFNAVIGEMLVSEIDITGIVTGFAKSNALRVLNQCPRRIAYSFSTLRFHWGIASLNNTELSAFRAGDHTKIEDIDNWLEYVVQEFTARTKLSVVELDELAKRDRDMTASEALKKGFTDEIFQGNTTKLKKSRSAKTKS